MVRHSLRALPIGAVALLSVLTVAPAPAAAVTPLADCADLTKAGETYVVTADITTTNLVCFTVLADRITIDLAGHTITGPGNAGGAAIFDNGVARISTVVKNGSIRSYGFGIRSCSPWIATRSTPSHMTASRSGRWSGTIAS